MKFRYSPVALAVFAALGSAGLTPVSAQQAQPQAQSLERVTITGTNIRRTDQETVSPVEIISREQIERSGQQTVAEVLARLPITSSGAFNETANSFAPGTQSVSLRGLGQDATLVLLNGRRVAGYGFAQNIQDSFVDLSSIPTSAIERIEILKDGASAIYGSDAIAGVINVILRRDYQGIEASGNVGFFQGKNDYRASIVAGFGDLGTQKFNVFGVLDYYKRDGLTMADTDFGADRDFRDKQGGRNFQSLSGGTWQGRGAAGSAAANARRAYAECPTPITYQDGVARGLFPVNQSALPPGTGANQPGNTYCFRDYASVFQVMPDIERIGFLGRGTYDFSAKVQGYAELGYSRSESDYVFQEPFFSGNPTGTTRLYPVAGGRLASSPFNMTFAPGAAGNPLPTEAFYQGVMNDFGTRNTNVTADSYRFLAGLKYTIGTWDFDSALGWSKSDVDQENKVLFTNGVIAAMGIPSTLQPPTPLVTNSQYNANRPSTNSPALRASMFGTNNRTAESELQFIDTKATTEFGKLPGGPIGLALGGEFRKESITDIPTELARTGGILGQGSTFVDGERDSLAFYGELALPLTRQLEAQLALRYDDYSDFGSSTNPKVGLKYRPAPEWLLRANWGRGFKAPSLPEITPSSAYFFTFVEDPAIPGVLSQIAGSINANPNLEPEKSRSFTMGLVFEPNRDFSASIDFYQIKWTNQVAFEDFQTLANDPNSPKVTKDPSSGVILSIAGEYINLGEVQTQGVDFDVRYKRSTPYGRVGTRLAASYLDEYEINGEEVAGTNLAWLYSNSSALPRWRGQWSFDWEQGPWVAQFTVNYIHSYYRTYGTLNAGSYFRPGTAGGVPQTGTLDPKSPSYTTYDLFGRYMITPNFGVSGSIINILDEEPIYDPSFSTTYFYDRQAGYDIRGRTFRIGVDYKFK
jgi:iron complex outermembrane receptor protein